MDECHTYKEIEDEAGEMISEIAPLMENTLLDI
jgi:hypothetical protein